VTISAARNTSVGSLTTQAMFTKNFRNGLETRSYPSGIEVLQESFARVYPNTF